MSSLLPTRDKPVKATRKGPRILVLYSKPKVGKTEELVELAQKTDTLIVDAEHGTDTYETTKINVENMDQVMFIPGEIERSGLERKKQGLTGIDQFPYKFVALDTIDAIEDFAEKSATKKYKNSTIGKSFEGNSVLELPKGGGYYYLREEVKAVIEAYARVTPYLILVVHIADKTIEEKDGTQVKVSDISLTGKLSSIVCAMADAIGYMYRDKKGQKRISFQTAEGQVMGARQKYLAGQDMPFSWEAIYPEVFETELQPA
jgi:hypothetical protein